MRRLLIAFILLTGCTNAWVTPADTSASNLDVKLVVLDHPNSSDGKNIVTAQFRNGGKSVRFGGTETVTCNGVALPLNELLFGYAERVPIEPVGGSYQFVYTRSGVPTTITLPVPARVVFTNPTAGATVARSSNMTINYVAGGGTGVNASGSGPAGNLNRNVFLPDNGTYTGMDSRTFGTGAGTLSLTRRFETSPAGTGFNSAATQYDSMSTINVIWN